MRPYRLTRNDHLCEVLLTSSVCGDDDGSKEGSQEVKTASTSSHPTRWCWRRLWNALSPRHFLCRPSALNVRESRGTQQIQSVTYPLETMNMCKNLFSVFLSAVEIWNKMVASGSVWVVSGCCWTRPDSIVCLTVHRFCDVLSVRSLCCSLSFFDGRCHH